MSRSTIHISLPQGMRSYVESRVQTAGYGSVSEFLRQLIREDRQREHDRVTMARRHAELAAAQVYRPLASTARQRK